MTEEKLKKANKLHIEIVALDKTIRKVTKIAKETKDIDTLKIYIGIEDEEGNSIIDEQIIASNTFITILKAQLSERLSALEKEFEEL